MRRYKKGFTLIEMAVVLAIIGLLLGGLLVTLSAQVEQRRISDTRKRLDDIKEALYGFVAANGRLPCPATSGSNGVEQPDGGSTLATTPCTVSDGFVPAATLGLTPIDSAGFILDGWETSPQNRIRYAVSNSNSSLANAYALTANNGIKTRGMGVFTSNVQLKVCSTSSTISGTSCGATSTLTNYAPAMIYSLGSNAPNARTGDETENANGDVLFISHEFTTDFDDTVTWLSLNTLFNRMITAGQLP